MRLVSGQTVERQAIVMLFGNGHRDRRIVAQIAAKYDHSKTILTPQLPHTPGPAVIATLAALVDQTLATTYAIVIDREHLAKLNEKLAEHAFKVLDREQLADGLIKMKCERGPKTITLYIATLGLTPNGHIEENLAKLIELTTGQKVQPTKKEINNWLRKHHTRDADLVANAPLPHLTQAFPTLTHLLQTLKQDP